MSFVCPHCALGQVPTGANRDIGILALDIGPYQGNTAPFGGHPRLGVEVTAIRCASMQCRRVTISTNIGSAKYENAAYKLIDGSTFIRRLPYPGSMGKPFPVGVPGPMLEDYNEAWSIIELSPKSSATLARRCLQAMIRDFCNIKKGTLFHEIEELEKQLAADSLPKGVEPETVEAMKVLKDKGNLGAHMTEVNGVIIDVEQGEAEQLLGLIEMLFADWYVARYKRQERLAGIVAMAKPKGRAEPAAKLAVSTKDGETHS